MSPSIEKNFKKISEIGGKVKILWAFDPFLENPKMHTKALVVLKSLFYKEDSLSVAYVASNSEVNLATAFNIPSEDRYSAYPKKIIKKELKNLGINNCVIDVLSNESLSMTSSVKKMAQFAIDSKADVILLASNGKKILPRIVLGSFAETLIHLSQTDILIYHQKTILGVIGPPKKILYAHDFSRKGAAGLARAVIYAKKWNAILSIVHVVRPELSTDEFYRQQLLAVTHKLERSLVAQDIVCEIHLEPVIKSKDKVILSVAKKIKANIIIVAAKSGNLAPFLGGGVTRLVLRESNLMTLVIKV